MKHLLLLSVLICFYNTYSQTLKVLPQHKELPECYPVGDYIFSYRDKVKALAYFTEIVCLDSNLNEQWSSVREMQRSDVKYWSLSSNNSDYFFRVSSYKSKKLKQWVQYVSFFNTKGEIKEKEIPFTEFFPVEKGEFVQVISVYANNNKLYLILQKENKSNENYLSYLVEIDAEFKHRAIEIPNSNITIDQLRKREKSHIRTAYCDEKEFVCYNVGNLRDSLVFSLTHISINSFSATRSYECAAAIPLQDYSLRTRPVSGTQFYLRNYVECSDLTYMENINGNNRFVKDLASGLVPYFDKGKIIFVASLYQGESNYTLITKINTVNQTEEIVFINNSNLTDSQEDKLSVYAYDLQNDVLLFSKSVKNSFRDYDTYYYVLEDGYLNEIRDMNGNPFLLPFFALHPQYLYKNGAYNFPGATPYIIAATKNLHVAFSADKVIILYTPYEYASNLSQPRAKADSVLFTYDLPAEK